MILDEHGRVDAERSAEEADFRRDMERDARAESQEILLRSLESLPHETLAEWALDVWNAYQRMIRDIGKVIR